MLCVRCQKEFEPTPDVARLITTGRIEKLCDTCARGESGMFSSSGEVAEIKRSKHSVLHQVDRFNADGKHTGYIKLPPLRKQNRRKPRPGRPGDNIRSYVMSESRQMSNVPALKIHTNLEDFRRRGEAFWVRKLPNSADPETGLGRFELPAGRITVEDDGGLEVWVRSEKHGSIRLLYRNHSRLY